MVSDSATRFNWRVAVIIVMLWVPVVFTIVLRVMWHGVPARIPTHWSGTGPADGFSDSSATWVICLLIAIGASLAGMATITFGEEIRPLQRGLIVGTCAGVAGIAVAAWPAFALSAIAAGGLKGDQDNTFVLLLAGLVWGALVLLTAGPRSGLGSQFNRQPAAQESAQAAR